MASSRDMVSFYLLDKNKKKEVITLLKNYKNTLPDKVILLIIE
jgi:hypothetical protein